MPIHLKSKPDLPSGKEASAQIQRLQDSPDFNASPQQMALLRYVVAQTLAGKADRIKGYTVATEVFGRRADFDQNIDPIVSIQAARLRKALSDYYQGAGRRDPLRIDIPKGTYVPEFSTRRPRTADPINSGGQTKVTVKSYWPCVTVRPLQNLSGDPDLDFWGIGLATEIAHELNRYPDIRVMTPYAVDQDAMIDQGGMGFKINGTLRRDSKSIKITVQLTNNRNGRLVWSESQGSAIAPAGMIALQESIARCIAVKIAGQQGHVAKQLASEFNRRVPKEMCVYEAVWRYYEYNLKLNPDSFATALEALEKAVAIDPECGQVWGMLAHLYANIHAFEIPGVEAPLEKALMYGQNATRLLPDDQRSRSIMAFIHLLRNELPTGLAEAEHALRLGPQTLFMLDSIGYLLALLGEWQRGVDLIEDVIQLNPFYTNTVHFALWLNCLRLETYAEAYKETMKLNRPGLFWDHLAKAATMGLLGRREEGRESASELLTLKPDFPERGRILIGHFIKFEELVERVITGLAAVGVEVE